MKTSVLIFVALCVIFLSSCQAGFEPVSYGHDACTQCKMTIMDKRYAAEIVTKKGKAFKFDDLACLRKYIREEHLSESEIQIFVADYNSSDNKFLNARQVVYLHGEMFKSPMNGDLPAFRLADHIESVKDSLHTEVLKWENLN